ncbi:hypothetical protein FK178_13645 [Antarcticibacterium arcticum]|uniref:Lipoprotein n=1 Tax=Antarcticibacterium arcticum TaxID=2585771 RepID=A0A5B8YPX1_9FLAO|nr:hypothetical protein [Antarcticibacterium arcticum]QED38693.1 hypothetical protein FK178_13645 [Antarcticibacterium arcticum]
MKKLIVLICILIFASCKSSKSSGTSEDVVSSGNSVKSDRFLIENLSEMNSEAINAAYSDANITEDVGIFDEGTEERAYTILYPNSPDEIHITWEDADKNKIYDIRFSESGKWRSSTGIKVGTTYNELNELNEKEVSFYGFGWDYSGAVNWNDGKFEDSNLFVFLEAKNIPGKFYGDHVIKASPEEIALMDLKVKTIMFKR